MQNLFCIILTDATIALYQGNKMQAEQAANEFVYAINRHDIDAISELMTEDHCFIDSDGTKVNGREQMRKGWQGYFDMMPDYRIRVTETLSVDNLVAFFGLASGTYAPSGKLNPDKYWEIPAAWLATVVEGKIREWRVPPLTSFAPAAAVAADGLCRRTRFYCLSRRPGCRRCSIAVREFRAGK